MPKRIPIKIAKQIGINQKCKQVILLAWDGSSTHIVTWGESLEDCYAAAKGGNWLKKQFGWDKYNDKPSRVRKIINLLRFARCPNECVDGTIITTKSLGFPKSEIETEQCQWCYERERIVENE